MTTRAKLSEYQLRSRAKRLASGSKFMNVWINKENVRKLEKLRVSRGVTLQSLFNEALEKL